MGKKKNTCKANKMKEKKLDVYRVTVESNGNFKEFLVTGDSFALDGGCLSVYKGEDEVAAFRCIVAIENLNEALAWGDKFEKMAMKDCCDPIMGNE